MVLKPKFGKLPPRFDPRTPQLHSYLTGPLASYPAKQDWITAGKVGYWGVMLNDTLGCCFPPGTRVTMADGTTKPIELVCASDVVMTAEGNTGPVTAVMTRYENSCLIRLVTWGHSHLKMTVEHPILTKRGYVRADEVVKGDWIAMPVLNNRQSSFVDVHKHLDNEQMFFGVKGDGRGAVASAASQKKRLLEAVSVIPRKVNLTPGFGRLIGLFLAEGSTNQNTIYFTFSKDERDTLVADTQRLLSEELGIESSVRERNSTLEVRVCSKVWRIIFRGLCGIGCGGKRLHADLLNGPPEFLEEVITGWMDGDGSSVSNNGRIGTTVSHALALDMLNIAQSLGKNCCITKRNPGISMAPNGPNGEKVPVKCSDTWYVTVRDSMTQPRIEVTKDIVWRPVRRTEKEAYSGRVFNMEVAGDNSYVAEGVGVHNCVIAAKGHLVIEYTTLTGSHQTVVLPDSVILQGYEAVGGYVPGQPNTDNGCDMLTAAQYYRATGFGGHRISAYASVAYVNLPLVYSAINLFGAVDIGFNVPQSAMDQFNAGKPWDVVANDGGIIGGHDVPVMAYDSVGKMFKVITWGKVQEVTEAFFLKYVDEAFTYLSQDWISAGLAPNKFNLAQLTSDISNLNSKAMPAVNWSSLITWVQMILHAYGPAAVPLVNALVAALPLTPAQVLIIQALIDQVLKEAGK